MQYNYVKKASKDVKKKCSTFSQFISNKFQKVFDTFICDKIVIRQSFIYFSAAKSCLIGISMT